MPVRAWPIPPLFAVCAAALAAGALLAVLGGCWISTSTGAAAGPMTVLTLTRSFGRTMGEAGIPLHTETPPLGIEHAVERERARIAADLHDGPVQALTAALLQLETVEAVATQKPAAHGAGHDLDAVHRTLTATVEELRGLLTDLQPPEIDELGLESALRAHLQALQRRTQLEIAATMTLGTALSPALETTLYRIAQEALRNVVRHAGAHRVSVVLASGPGSVTLEIRDDGVGFDPRTVVQQGGRRPFGLTAMRERARQAGGELHCSSQPGGGTIVRASLPDPTGAAALPPAAEATSASLTR